MRRHHFLSPWFLAIVAVLAIGRDAVSAVEILYFKTAWCGFCTQADPVVKAFAERNPIVRTVDGDAEPKTREAYRVNGYPCFVAVDNGKEVGRLSGVPREADLYGLLAKGKTADVQPSPQASVNPRPWTTSVRITVPGEKQRDGRVVSNCGSGTIVASDGQSAIVLTCSHIFPNTDPKGVKVDLFDGKLTGPRKNQVTYRNESYRGRLIALDRGADVALLRIDPGKPLPFSPVVPKRWEPAVGMGMNATGCPNGADATTWGTKITKTDVSVSGGHPFIQTETGPAGGRSGGGLFTVDGFVAGVCCFRDTDERHGLYAAPESIRALLDAHHLAFVYDETPRPANLYQDEPRQPGPLGKFGAKIVGPLKRKQGDVEAVNVDIQTAKSEIVSSPQTPSTTTPAIPPPQGPNIDAGHVVLGSIVAIVAALGLAIPNRAAIATWFRAQGQGGAAIVGTHHDDVAPLTPNVPGAPTIDHDAEILRLAARLISAKDARDAKDLADAREVARQKRVDALVAKIEAATAPEAEPPKA